MTPAPLQIGPLGALRALAADLVNAARAEAGLAPLALDGALCQAAQEHAEAMAGGRRPYAHTAPDGTNAHDRIAAASGRHFAHTAENIARIERTAPEPGEAHLRDSHVRDFHAGWMGSPAHREAILSPAPNQFGFGIAGAGDTVFAVATFAGPGAPRGLRPGGSTSPIDLAAAAARLIEGLNRHRPTALRSDPALATVGAALLPADLRRGALTSTNLFALLPLPEQPLWRDIATCTALCGACGDHLTQTDVDDFLLDILRADGARVTDQNWSAAGAAFAVDGAGWKLVVLVLGRRF